MKETYDNGIVSYHPNGVIEWVEETGVRFATPNTVLDAMETTPSATLDCIHECGFIATRDDDTEYPCFFLAHKDAIAYLNG